MNDSMLDQIPTGFIVQRVIDGQLVSQIRMDDGSWRTLDGNSFSAKEFSELAAALEKPKPKFLWRHPVRTFKAQIDWNRGNRMTYGGPPDFPNLPDLRYYSEPVPRTMTVPFNPPKEDDR